MPALHHTVLLNATPYGEPDVLHYAMAEDADIRRDNFKALMGRPFSPRDAAAKLWGTPQLWSDLFHGRKAFGEKLARRIEEKLMLDRMSLDDPGGSRPAALSSDLLAHLTGLSVEDRTNAENLLRMYLKLPPLGVAASPVVLPGKQDQHAA